MVRNCSELLKSSSGYQDNDFTLGSQIHPLNDGQRFWFLADNEDNPKLCTYIRDVPYAQRATTSPTQLSHDDSFGTVPHTGSGDVSLPTGAIVQVYTPTELSALTDSEKLTQPPQWPQTNTTKGYRWPNTQTMEKLFRGLTVNVSPFSAPGLLYSLNMHQAQAEALFNGLETLHSNGHYKYYADDTKRLYLDKEGFQHDTIEFYIFSDNLFLVGDRLPFISHGNIIGSITEGNTTTVNLSKLLAETEFYCYRFRYTITA